MKHISLIATGLLLLALLLPLFCVPVGAVGYDSANARENTAWSETVVDILTFTFQNGERSIDKTVWYGIYNAAGLKHFSELINNSTYFGFRDEDTKVCLCASIDMNSISDFIPIGNGMSKFDSAFPGRAFNGVFDGRGYVIENLSPTPCASDTNKIAYISLFGAVAKSATIRNVVLGSGCNFTYTGNYSNSCVAALAARVEEGATISNVLNLAPVSGGAYCGGIVGYVNGSSDSSGPVSLSDCTNAGTVSGKTATGGLVGMATGRVTATNCRVSGNITGTGSVGSVLGKTEQTDGNITVRIVLNFVSVESGMNYVGTVGSSTTIEPDNNCQQNADPASGVLFHGVQLSNGSGADKVSVRFIASLDRETPYTEAGFRITVTNIAEEKSADRNYTCQTLFTSLLGQTAEETVLYTAESLRGSGGYLFAATIRNIPMSVGASFSFAVTAYANDGNSESATEASTMILTRTAEGGFTVTWNR